MCPHKRELVLSRGLLGDAKGVPKVACPVHKKAFSLETGKCLSGDDFAVEVFPVKVEGDEVFVQVSAAINSVKAANGSHTCDCGSRVGPSRSKRRGLMSTIAFTAEPAIPRQAARGGVDRLPGDSVESEGLSLIHCS